MLFWDPLPTLPRSLPVIRQSWSKFQKILPVVRNSYVVRRIWWLSLLLWGCTVCQGVGCNLPSWFMKSVNLAIDGKANSLAIVRNCVETEIRIPARHFNVVKRSDFLSLVRKNPDSLSQPYFLGHYWQVCSSSPHGKAYRTVPLSTVLLATNSGRSSSRNSEYS